MKVETVETYNLEQSLITLREFLVATIHLHKEDMNLRRFTLLWNDRVLREQKELLRWLDIVMVTNTLNKNNVLQI